MIDVNTAHQIAYDHIRTIGLPDHAAHYIILEQHTREEPFGWIFFWSDRRYIETEDPKYFVAGNGPVVVLRTTGKIMGLPGRDDLNKKIQQLSKYLNEND
jgi:hypothetical protein